VTCRQEENTAKFIDDPDIPKDRFLVYPDGSVFDLVLCKFKRTNDNGYGYRTIPFYSFEKKKTLMRYQHRLVAEYFVDGAGEQVNHKDGDRTNNNHSNLEWVSAKDNIAHGIQTGKINQKGRCVFRPLEDCDLVNIAKMLCTTKNYTQIGKELDIPRTTISSVVNGRSSKEYFTKLVNKHKCGDEECLCWDAYTKLTS
jgi:hypothetical protein